MSKKKSTLKNWLFSATRIVGLNPVSFQEKWRINLTRVQLISVLILFVFLLFLISFSIIAYTPASNLLPETVSNKNKKEAQKAYTAAEKLSERISQQELYIENLQKVILGEISIDSIYNDNSLKGENYTPDFDTSRTSSEIALEQVVLERKGETTNQREELNELFLADPVIGKISQRFNAKTHPGVDIITPAKEPILACKEGIVIYSAYSDLDGWTIIVKHPNELTSVYKHCEKVLKSTGDRVNSGESIAIVGNSGTRTTGPHLHFELWGAEGALNPLDYFSFKK